MKVLYCKWGSICENAFEHAFNKLGINTLIFTQRLIHSDYDKEYMNGLADCLKKNNFDCVFSVNFVPIISKVCNIFEIPYLCQVVDHPSRQLYAKALANPCNRVFLFDKKQYEKFYNINPDGIFYMPLACDYDYYAVVHSMDDDHEAYDCDISFVGSLYSEKCVYNSLENMPDYLKGYSEGIIESQINLCGYNLIEESLTDSFVKEFKKYVDWGTFPNDYFEDTKGLIADVYLGEKCTEQSRIRTLKNISDHFEMDMYTASDLHYLPKVHNRGIADSITMMPKIFQCSKINLNMTNIPIQTGIPQRVYDILGAGGFLLSNYQSELTEYFEIGKELEVYESKEDLLNKIDYYLTHEEERKIIAENGKKAIKEKHQYYMRLSLMFEICFGRAY